MVNERSVELIATIVEVHGCAGAHEIDLLAGADHLERADDVVDILPWRVADLADRFNPHRRFRRFGVLHRQRRYAYLVVGISREQERGPIRSPHLLDELLVRVLYAADSNGGPG